MIRLEGLTKSFQEVDAVRGVDLSIPSGEIFGLLGPNGAGKTTTIRLMVGLLRPDTGRVELAGVDVAAKPQEAKQELGYIPDRPYIYEKLTGREYLAYIGSLWQVEEATALSRAEAVLERFRLTHALDRLVEGYSHGMKQKLAFAGVFLHQPKVYVIDEPMVGLDPHAAREVRKMFREVADQGATVLVTTHQLEVAEATCDRIGILQEGRIAAIGSMAELRAHATDPDSNLESIFLQLTEEAKAELAEARAQVLDPP